MDGLKEGEKRRKEKERKKEGKEEWVRRIEKGREK